MTTEEIYDKLTKYVKVTTTRNFCYLSTDGANYENKPFILYNSKRASLHAIELIKNKDDFVDFLYTEFPFNPGISETHLSNDQIVSELSRVYSVTISDDIIESFNICINSDNIVTHCDVVSDSVGLSLTDFYIKYHNRNKTDFYPDMY